jgi:hypothetical protein
MNAPTATVLTFRPRQAAPETVHAQPAPAARGRNDAEIYDFAAAILREGFHLATIHANVTVPRLNSAGPLRR